MNIQLGKVLYQLEPDTITCFSVNITKHNWSSDLVYLSISLEESSHPKNTKQSQGCKCCKWIRQSVAFGSPTASANSGMVNKQRTATQMHSETHSNSCSVLLPIVHFQSSMTLSSCPCTQKNTFRCRCPLAFQLHTYSYLPWNFTPRLGVRDLNCPLRATEVGWPILLLKLGFQHQTHLGLLEIVIFKNLLIFLIKYLLWSQLSSVSRIT